LNVNDFATINYVDQRDSATLSSANADAASKYVPKTGGAFTGDLRVGGETTIDSALTLKGGDSKQNIISKTGFAGYLCYGNSGEEKERRLAWGANHVWLYKDLDLQGNKIVDLADPDPSEPQQAVTVNYLNEAIGNVTTDVPNANTTTKGIDFRGQCGTHSGSNPTLKKGQLSFDASSGKLYIGTG
jgi:hypothetical protein